MIAGSCRLSQSNVLYAGEIVHNDDPWTVGNNYLKFNGMIRYSGSNGDQDWRITAMGTHSDWRATDQIPRRAIGMGTIRRFIRWCNKGIWEKLLEVLIDDPDYE